MEKIKIMIINDSLAMQTYLKETIGSFPDCEIINCSSDGKIALLVLKHKKPDVILLDLEMPRLDGLSFLEEMSRISMTPAIIMSVYAKEESQVLSDAINAGAVSYIAPPEDDSHKEHVRFKAKLHANIIKANLMNNLEIKK